MTEDEISEWIKSDLPVYSKLTDSVKKIIEDVFHKKNVYYISIESRTKKEKNISEKIRRKGYLNPKIQMMDISGIRIIVDIESQLEAITKVVSETFHVDTANSGSKENLLAVNQIGYRSTHYVCKLGEDRLKLTENEDFINLPFEIQIRTMLQHTWASITHDRSYKFDSILPKEIQRAVFLYAGLLEIADNGFSRIVNQIEEYAEKAKSAATSTDVDLDLNSLSLDNFVTSWSENVKFDLLDSPVKNATSKLVRELNDFGIFTIGDLRSIIPKDYVRFAKELKYETTISGLLRDWMLLADHEKYRNQAWNKHWYYFSSDDSDLGLYRLIVGDETVDKIEAAFRED